MSANQKEVKTVAKKKVITPLTNKISTSSDGETLAAVYFYAVLNDADIVQEVISTPFPAPSDYTQYVSIETLDESLVGKKYNRLTGQFEDPSSTTIIGDASEITINNQPNYRLAAKLNEIDAALHTHTNATVLAGITAAKVASWDAGTGSGGGTSTNAYTKVEADFRFAARGEAYTKAESDNRYAAIGSGGSGSGTNGITPHIGENGHWFLGTSDTGVSAQGPAGTAGTPGLNGTEILPIDVLTKIKTVDGNDSGLDADTVDGLHSSAFAKTSHTHIPADINGTVPLAKGGTGATTASGALEALGAATSNHIHTGYAQSSHTHTGFAATNHSHTDYAYSDHQHTGFASSNHSHNPSSIGAAAIDHAHDTFTGMTYFGDTIHLTGQLRVGGQQMVYCTGAGTSTLSSNNVETNIGGSKLYARVPLTVNSDERLKKNIVGADQGALRNLVNQIEVKTYELKDEGDNAEGKLGVIAQQLVDIDPALSQYFVSTNKDTGMLGVSYELLVLPLIAAVQDLTRRIEELEVGSNTRV